MLLSDEEKAKAFGNNTDIWYNAEVMFPSNPNVIHYDTKTLKIHDSGHKRRNRETGRPENADVSESLAVLDNNLKKMQKTIAVDSDVRFVRSAILKLKKQISGLEYSFISSPCILTVINKSFLSLM